jgi:4-aminobutyrate aminotransferase/(S)-3-amino-2-methylpropionate transaminase
MADKTPIEQKRVLVTDVPGPRSKEIQARREAAVSAGVSSGLPAYIQRGQGAILVDVDGNQLLDLGAGIAVASVGHAHPKVAAAIADQAEDLLHTCFMVTPYEEYVEVAEQLSSLTPGDFPKATALFSSGAEAVENAVKVARLATGKAAIVVFDNAYHGRTNLTMALTAKNMPYKDRFGPFAPEVYRAPMSYPLRDGLSGEEAARRAIDFIEVQVGAHNVAGILIEPIQGEGGFITPAPGFLPALQRWANESDILFIADEVQTGFCRTG